jgi:hypothetical protein
VEPAQSFEQSGRQKRHVMIRCIITMRPRRRRWSGAVGAIVLLGVVVAGPPSATRCYDLSAGRS